MNWVIVEGSSGPALIDTGYPADEPAVRASLDSLGYQTEDLQAILLTHGHGDHMGNAALLSEEANCPVFTGRTEIRNVRREITEQVTFGDTVPHLLRAGVARWVRHALKSGGLEVQPVLNVLPLPSDSRILSALLGLECTPIELPGHTSGHTCFYFPRDRVAVVGDALVTAHPTSPQTGPQLLPSIFHSSDVAARTSLARLRETAAVHIVPGHGPVFSGGVDQAIADALRFGAAF